MAAPTFTQALTQAETQARTTLDSALHERLSCALALVTDGRVFQCTDGTWQVESASREGLIYGVNGTCTCDDVRFNHPPQGLCKHRLAVYLARRASQLLAQPPTPILPEVPQTAQEPTAPPTTTGDTSAVPEAPQGLGEAPASVPVRLAISGREGFPIVFAKFWGLRSAEGSAQQGGLSFSQEPLPLTS